MVEITEADISALETELERINFDKARREVLMDNTSCDVQACPGSGKTTLLAAKLMIISKKWQWSNKGVCVLSHTNVAKDEIIKRLKKHPTGWRFLEYPHFIGTIQEFVNRFLATPYVRDRGWPIISIDDDRFVSKFARMPWKSMFELATGKKRNFKYFQFKKKIDPYQFRWTFDGNLKVNQSFLSRVSNHIDIKKSALPSNYFEYKKEQVSKSGYFQFREMYAFAEANLSQNIFLKKALRGRFKLVFIDEMQDTQKHQDDLIEKIFPHNAQVPSVQRFGDADQAIFDGMNDAPNDSFDGDNCKHCINDSHRFSPCIANLVRGLSFSNLELKSSHECINGGNHAECKNFGNNLIYVYDTEGEAKQIPQLYADHLDQVFNGASKTGLNAMAIGAIGKKSEKDFHVRIDKFFENFTKSKKSSNPKFGCLYECVVFAGQQSNPNVQDNYELLTNCLLYYLYGLDVEVNLEDKQNNLNRTNFRSALKLDKENLRTFNKVIGYWATDKTLPSPQNWKSATQNLFDVLNNVLNNIPAGFSSNSFWSYPSDEKLEEYRNAENFNIVKPKNENGISVTFDTIHGVKGQTHDATLVLETNFGKKMDVGTLIKNFSDPGAVRQDKKQSKIFMKKLYVAMSRPKSVLCLAVHKDSITGYEDDLEKIGWKIQLVKIHA